MKKLIILLLALALGLSSCVLSFTTIKKTSPVTWTIDHTVLSSGAVPYTIDVTTESAKLVGAGILETVDQDLLIEALKKYLGSF